MFSRLLFLVSQRKLLKAKKIESVKVDIYISLVLLKLADDVNLLGDDFGISERWSECPRDPRCTKGIR